MRRRRACCDSLTGYVASGMITQADIVLHEIPEKVRHMMAGNSVPRTVGIVGSHAVA
jgi:hypothetical protein